ncbi:MAG: Terminase-like family protein, partial [Gammaproteobacteria bacterium]
MAKLQLDYAPQPKQQLLHSTACQQILFGGSAGGSKSHTLRWDLVTFCLLVPGLEAFLFRRTYGELFDNHIRPLLRELPKEAATYKVTQNLFEFANGSKIILAHCSDPLDYLRYMGAEFHILAIDEASLFDPMQLIELRGRVRLGSFAKRVPKNVRPFLPRCLFASNPGGPAHSFLKRTFI